MSATRTRLAAAAAVCAAVFLQACSRAPETPRAPEGDHAADGSAVTSATPVVPGHKSSSENEIAEPDAAKPDTTEPDAGQPRVIIKPVVLEPLPPEPEGGGLGGLDAIRFRTVTAEAVVEIKEDNPPPLRRAERTRPRLVAFPFESAFDDGALGRKVAVVVTGHAARTGRFETLPKITQDEILRKRQFVASLDTDPRRIAAHAREAFDADIAIWGRVTGGRAKPVLEVRALDMRREKDPLVLAERYACANIHYIPIFAGEIIAAISGLDPLRPRYATTVRALSGNLLANGDFRRGLAGWTPHFPECAKAEGRRLVFTIPKKIAAGHGMSVLSEFIPVERGAHYEMSLRVRSHGPSVITWVKGYVEFEARSEGEKAVDARREVFRHQMRPASQEKPGPDGWIEVTTRPFRPRNPKVPVTWMRVKLYACWPAGRVEFEKVSLRKVEVEGETPEEEDARTRRAWGGKDPGEALEDKTP